MRVLHLLSSTGVHGAEIMAIELTRQLRNLGLAPCVGLLETGGPTSAQIRRRLDDNGTENFLVPCRRPLDVRGIRFLRRFLQDRGIEVVHSHGYKPDFYAFAARRGTNARLVGTCHNWLGRDLKMRFYAALDKRILRRFDAVAGVSSDVVTELRRYVANDKVRRIGNGIDPEFFRRTHSSERAKEALGQTETQLIGFIGRLSHDKGVLDLLDATSALHQERADVRLLVVGDGEDRAAFEQRARILGRARRYAVDLFSAGRIRAALLSGRLPHGNTRSDDLRSSDRGHDGGRHPADRRTWRERPAGPAA